MKVYSCNRCGNGKFYRIGRGKKRCSVCGGGGYPTSPLHIASQV